MKDKIKQYYPFWLGLFCCILLVYMFKNSPSVAILIAFMVGYFKLTDFNK